MKFALCILFVLTVTARECENGQSGSNTQTISIPAGCKENVDIFNENVTKKIINEIKFVNNKLGRLPEELVSTYPSARVKWNSGLSDIKSSFTENFMVEIEIS